MIAFGPADAARRQPGAEILRASSGEHGPTSSAAPHIVVTGPVHEARFPPLCARCGAAAGRTLSIQKLFWRSGGDEGSPYHVLGEVHAPFCERCLAQHAREARPIDPRIKRTLYRRWLLNELPFLFPVGVLLFVFVVAARATLEALAHRVPPWQAAAPAGMALFFALCIRGFYRGFRRHGEQLIHEREPRSRRTYVQIERGPLGSRFIVEMEPTQVQLAVDFSDDVSEPFEGERHQFTFQSAEMAARFRELNVGRARSPTSRRARLATVAQFTVILAIALVLVYALIFDRG